MKIAPARVAAFDVLYRIETEKAFSSSLLPLYEESLSTSDSALCHEITLGALRKQIHLDRIIEVFAGAKKLDAAVRVALRIGLYQLLFLERIPDYSAINESVSLVQRAKKTSAKGFVNAVLRRAATEKVQLQFTDEVDRISVETSTPRWLIEKWINVFGVSETVAVAAANNKIPQTTFRLTASGDEIDPQIIGRSQRSEFVDGCFVTERIDQGLRDLERNGAIYFQDEASQMVASAFEIPNDGSFLDVCAAPGGKTGMIAQRHASTIKLAAAGDLYWPRVEYLRGNCRRQGVEFVRAVQYDATHSLPFADESFDAVLVDAPCSGTGTIRHNPEIRYFLTPEDINELSTKQLKILKNASKTVKRGGLLIYSTCSLEREENEMVALSFLAEHPAFGIVKPNVLERFVGEDGFVRTRQHRDNLDGFFIATFMHNG